MLNKRISLIALGMLSATSAMANDQAESKGFQEDSSLKVLLRNAYINRDYKDGNKDKAEWGQAAIGTFSSGFTQGTVGVGVDAFGLYALRLDGGKGRSGAGGIDFFKQGDSGNAADDLSKFGAAVKFRVSNTVLTYGDQMPALPVLNYDNSRLLPESYTGTLITSKEIKGLELNAGRFTAESRKSAEGRDSGGLKSINVLGGSYQFTEQFKAALYASDVEDVLKKQYVNANYVFPIDKDQSLTLDFNGYRTKLDNSYVRENTIPGKHRDRSTTTRSGAWLPPSPLAHTRSPWRTSAPPATATWAMPTAVIREVRVASATVATPSTWPTPTGPTSTLKTNAAGNWATASTSAHSAYRA